MPLYGSEILVFSNLVVMMQHFGTEDSSGLQAHAVPDIHFYFWADASHLSLSLELIMCFSHNKKNLTGGFQPPSFSFLPNLWINKLPVIHPIVNEWFLCLRAWMKMQWLNHLLAAADTQREAASPFIMLWNRLLLFIFLSMRYATLCALMVFPNWDIYHFNKK